MKKRDYVIYIFIFMIIFSFQIKQIDGETITGEATNANLAISISVIGAPSISIISPENETYITSTNLLLNYSEENADNLWYNLDNGENVSLTSPVYFNSTEGTHILYLYANNSHGKSSTNIIFTINLSNFRVYYSKYTDSNKGGSTNFNISSYENMQNLSKIILENTNYGKIEFNTAINLIEDHNPDDNELDLDSYTEISSNRIEINSTALPNFNKSATLYLYNLTFSNPRILRDGSVCPSTICTEQGYSSETGTLIFNVTHFTIYSAEETPTGVVIKGGGGGGGGGKKDFSIDKETISVTLKQGGTEKDFFIIKNTGNKELDFTIQTENIEEFLKISESDFSLNAGESKTIVLDFLSRAEVIPNLYLGKLIIKGDGIEKEILVSVEVESRSPIFDVKIEIPKRFLYLMPGEELISNIKIFNLERETTTDVFVEYIIKDEEENEILCETETIFVETQTSFTKSFEIPRNIKSGPYIFYVRTSYNGEIASSTAWFNIGKTSFMSFILRNLNIIGIILGIISTFIILIVILRKLNKIKITPIKKVLKKKSIKKEEREGFRYYKQRIRKGIEKNKK